MIFCLPYLLKRIRVILFRSELRNWLFRKPRNATEHFLLRNNGNHSESIPRNFFRNEILLPNLLNNELCPLFLLPWSFSPIPLPSFLCPYTFFLFSIPFCSTFIPVPSSQYPYFSTLIPVTISIPLIFPFIPHTTPILSLTFPYSPSSIRSSLTLHSSQFSYPFLVISHSSPSSPIPVPVRLHNSKEGAEGKTD
jgi:hypothetical protein